MKFCAECGTPFAAATQLAGPFQALPRRPHRPPPFPNATAERRQLTVLFCDIVGSTALAEQLDPEELRDVIRTYQEICAEVIQRFGGYIAQYLGDGLLVYFGHPTAHEDDAAQAVRAGLSIVQTIRESSLRKTILRPVHVRIGIHTGHVVVGEVGGGERRERLALGETPNIAARLQDLAPADTVVISGATARLVTGLYEWRELGLQSLRGLSRPIAVYQVLRESGARDRFGVAVQQGLTPMVGREGDVRLLLDRWRKAWDGQGQMILLSGESGIGKSRLAQEIKEHISRQGAGELEFRCSEHFQHSAFYPEIEYFQRQVQFQRNEKPQQTLARLEVFLRDHPLPPQEAVPLFADLLSVPLSGPYAPLDVSPQRQKQRIQKALVAWLLAQAERRPLLVVWEDVHWADASTLELLRLLIDQMSASRIMVLLAFRPDFVPHWTMRPHMTQLTLSRLGRQQVGQLIKEIAGNTELPDETIRQVVDKTDGVPLFVEELTKMVIESERSPDKAVAGVAPLAIPATLHDSLMARLDQLGVAKEVAQLGAALGRAFSHELIQAVWLLEDQSLSALQHGLGRLAAMDLISQKGEPPYSRWVFKHALIQDAAYQSLLRSKRQHIHQHIAQVLVDRFPGTAQTQPELVAHHYTQADLREAALGYWKRAGERAFERSAHIEAIGHLTKGLELLETLPPGAPRARHELALQTILGPGLIATKGYAAQEVKDAYARAQELGSQTGETAGAFSALRGLWVVHEMRGELQTARELGDQLLLMTQSLPDQASLIEVHRACGNTLLWLGEFALAREHLEHAIALYQADKHRGLAILYGSDPKVVCLFYNALTLWLLGYPDQALQHCHQALSTAQAVSHTHSLAAAQNWAAMLYQMRGERTAAQDMAQAAIRLSEKQGFPQWLTMGTMFQGWASAMQHGDGLEQLTAGLAAWRAAGSELLRPYFLSLLAEVQLASGQPQDGLLSLDEALQAAEEHDERFYEAELYRLKGEGILNDERRMQNDERQRQTTETSSVHRSSFIIHRFEEAEAYFQRAIDIARQQAAKAWELRATLSLARVWEAQGKATEARRLLSEVYSWFTEGFDTPDLQAAKRMLDRLG